VALLLADELAEGKLRRDFVALLVQARQLDRLPGDVSAARPDVPLDAGAMDAAQIVWHQHREALPDQRRAGMPEDFSVARLTNRIRLSSSIVMMASEALSATVRERPSLSLSFSSACLRSTPCVTVGATDSRASIVSCPSASREKWTDLIGRDAWLAPRRRQR
jgi:hypothetical protein